MEPATVLSKKRKEIINKWFDAAMSPYPEGSDKFFKNNSDPFANPVGNTIFRCLNELFDELMKTEMDTEAVRHALDGIIRIQSLQEFQPSDAIGFIFEIRPSIKGCFQKNRGDKAVEAYFKALAANTETVLRMAFDLYMECRQKVFLLRANHANDRVRQLLVKKGYIQEIPKKGKNLEDIDV
ncbi:MAG: RsbRD N-terminal domain-containing protein [Desulfosalsimonadaceae bacterium]